MKHIIERVSSTFPELGEIRNRVIFNNPPATNGLIKEALYVKMKEESTRVDRLQVSNTIYSVIEDSSLLIMDAVNLEEDTARNMKIIDFFSACTSTICFILGAF
jgi:hypothetical protein